MFLVSTGFSYGQVVNIERADLEKLAAVNDVTNIVTIAEHVIYIPSQTSVVETVFVRLAGEKSGVYFTGLWRRPYSINPQWRLSQSEEPFIPLHDDGYFSPRKSRALLSELGFLDKLSHSNEVVLMKSIDKSWSKKLNSATEKHPLPPSRGFSAKVLWDPIDWVGLGYRVIEIND